MSWFSLTSGFMVLCFSVVMTSGVSLKWCLYEGSSESEEIVVEEKQRKVITGPVLLVASSVRESVFDIER